MTAQKNKLKVLGNSAIFKLSTFILISKVIPPLSTLSGQSSSSLYVPHEVDVARQTDSGGHWIEKVGHSE